MGDGGAIACLGTLAPTDVVTQGSPGATLDRHGHLYAFPTLTANEVEPTWAGDVFAIAFFRPPPALGRPFRRHALREPAASLAVEDPGINGVHSLPQIRERFAIH